MAARHNKFAVEVQGLQDGNPLVPLSQAAKVAEILATLPIDVKNSGTCRIEVNNGQVDIFGVDRGLNQCVVNNPAKVKSIHVTDSRITFEVDNLQYSKIVVHTDQLKTCTHTYSSSTSSSGESRSGYGSRSSG